MLALALMALGVRTAAPPGYMLEANAEGVLAMALCGDHAAFGPAVFGPIEPAHPSGKHPAQEHCAFASAAAPAPAASAPPLSAPAPAFIIATARIVTAHIGQGLAAPPPPSTGPPTLS